MDDNSKESISGPCVVCDNIVSFEAPTCPKCGQPDAGKKAKEAAEAGEKPLTKEVPISVGGGIRTLEDINQALKSGADKVVVTCSKCGKSFEFHKEGWGHVTSSFLWGMSPVVGAVATAFWNPHKDKPPSKYGCPHCGHGIPKDSKPKK